MYVTALFIHFKQKKKKIEEEKKKKKEKKAVHSMSSFREFSWMENRL